jgi:phosphotransferase system  glucose/maltose/N-acetylglucosamine-specific IIC component
MKGNKLSKILYIIAVLLIVISFVMRESNGIRIYNLAFVIGIIGLAIKAVRKYKDSKDVFIIAIFYALLAMPFIYSVFK